MLLSWRELPFIFCKGSRSKLSEKQWSDIGIGSLVTKPILRYQIEAAIGKFPAQRHLDESTGIGDAAWPATRQRSGRREGVTFTNTSFQW